MKDERGFTLIEVLASLVIISIVLMSFMSIFANTNAQAVSNTEKLVVVNLADAYLERVKVDPVDIIKTETKDPTMTITKYIDSASCPSVAKIKKCKDIIIENQYTTLNSKVYKVKLQFTQSQERSPSTPSLHSEKELKLINVLVTVTSPTSNLSSSVEGYISHE